MDLGGTEEVDQSRRSFLTKVWLGLGLVALTEFALLVVSFLRPRKSPVREGGFGGVVVCGPVDDFAVNTVTPFPRGHFYVCRLEDGGFLVLSRTCTHLGCTVPWIEEEKKFLCPCHSSAFDIRGNVISKPAPRALDLYAVFIENNIVKVDTGRSTRRSEFRVEQVTYPKDA